MGNRYPSQLGAKTSDSDQLIRVLTWSVSIVRCYAWQCLSKERVKTIPGDGGNCPASTTSLLTRILDLLRRNVPDLQHQSHPQTW